MVTATRSVDAARLRFCSVAALLALGVALFVPSLFVPGLLADGDTYWHLAAGDWIIAHRAVPTTDPFSFTAAGQPWHAQEWLAELIMALAFRAGGWAGLVGFFALVFASIVAVLAWPLSRVRTPVAAAALAAAASCIGPSLLARPHLIALLLLALWQAALWSARERRRVPWALPALMLPWANLHASYPLGLALLALFTAEQAFRGAFRRWLAVLLAAGLAACVTPWGPAGLTFPLQLLRMQALGGITEWRPTNFAAFPPIEIALLLLLAAACSGRLRLGPLRLLILLAAVALGLHHARHQMVAGVLGGLLLARPLERGFGAREPSGRSWPFAAALAACALLAVRLALAIVRADDAVSPAAALAAVPPALRAEPMLNAYDFGGYLIWRGLRPYVDGRTDLYGDAFLRDDDAIAQGNEAALRRAIDRWHPRWALLRPGPAVAALHRLGWRRAYGDPAATLYLAP